jgi:quercetin dioxygenase-like cupin family protein
MTHRSAILFLVATLGGCAQVPSDHGHPHPPMAAVSAVARADGGKGPNEHRIIPLRSMSGDVELLYGDPEQPGPFVMRIHELPGAIVPPHSHPVDEHVTILEGTWYFAIGEKFDKSALQELKAGGYAFAPKGSSMFAFSPDGAIVQVHGVGPFAIDWRGGLHTLDDADAKTVFELTKGLTVESDRCAGRILQGYASGEIIQYEVLCADGRRIMANEDSVRVAAP